jgi:hypothetical protein
MVIRYWWLIISILFITSPVYSLDRCRQYIQLVRIAHTIQFGLSYPYWYGVGQLEQESLCRANITAFDGGQGIAQFMPKTESWIEELMGEDLDMMNPKQAIRAQAFYMHRIHEKENWTGLLFADYQIYNGGRTNLYKEYLRAGKEVNWEKMKANCQRKKLTFKWGILDFCEVNYDYSVQVYRKGQQYKTGVDGLPFW